MFLRLFLLLALTPLLELWALTEIGMRIGALQTLLLVIATGAAGALLARWQGLETLREIRRQMSQGQMPAAKLLDGMMILIAGVLLLIPGIITDVMGLSLLIPPIRRMVLRYVGSVIKAKMIVRVQSFGSSFTATATTRGAEADIPTDVIDAEFERRPTEQKLLTDSNQPPN